MNKACLARLALDVRSDLGLGATDRFDVQAWSELWGVPILSLGQATDDAATLHRLTVEAPQLWSAAVIKDDLSHLIIYNHAHGEARVLSDLAHEIAHLVSEHPLDVAWMEPSGKRCGASPTHEKEAAELGGALLVPPDEAKIHAIYGRDPDALAERYGVSREMAKWRMSTSGGHNIRRRWLAKQGTREAR